MCTHVYTCLKKHGITGSYELPKIWVSRKPDPVIVRTQPLWC